MFYFIIFFLILAAAKLSGGKIGRVGHLKLRGAAYLLPLFVLMELTFDLISFHTERWIPEMIYAGSFVVLSVFFLLNWHVKQMRVLAVGSLMNALVIIANKGVMPASRWAQRTSGIFDDPDKWQNSAIVANAKVPFLGDILATPKSWGLFSNVFSIGDILIYIGFAMLIWSASHDESLDEVDTEKVPESAN